MCVEVSVSIGCHTGLLFPARPLGEFFFQLFQSDIFYLTRRIKLRLFHVCFDTVFVGCPDLQ